MRRFPRLAAAVLGIVMTAGLFTFTSAATASAAEGVLFVNAEQYVDPSGCVPVNPDQHPTFVRNHTDSDVLVFLWPDCRGPIVGVIHPFHHAFLEAGDSLFVP